MSRPVIGITSYIEKAAWGVWDVPVTLVPQGYVDGVTRAGGRPVVIPPDEEDVGVLDRLDGLILSGGADLAPALYGSPAHRETRTAPYRDAAELTLLREALARDLPVLAVCRGLQLLAVVYGGRLHQHLPEALGTSAHRPAVAVYGEVPVTLAPGSLAASILGPSATVKCYHHQGVADPGTLTVTGWSPDGLPEAAEDPARRFVLGVQWHPEEMGDDRLFAALVDNVRTTVLR
uniref:gamma-glutamyl-gamma-aminobutyrate hydrolase family protein n=1 Tax=Herbidospora sakaeratensis TaxID=564415 RepID=UPI00078655D6|nr:gamma-glutamyl-gamma-aminobutyrate hydrolase family protein [Herbidospora sakaeratensis]